MHTHTHKKKRVQGLGFRVYRGKIHRLAEGGFLTGNFLMALKLRTSPGEAQKSTEMVREQPKGPEKPKKVHVYRGVGIRKNLP